MNFIDYDPPDWDIWFMQGVYWIASKSKDPKTKIGALLIKEKRIISTGYNGIPAGVEDSDNARHERPEKYKWYEHGERNAIFSAAKHGINTNNSTLYTNALPCADCARGIIQAGINHVYVHKQFIDVCNLLRRDQWIHHELTTMTMFKEANIEISVVNSVLGCKAYIDGQVFNV